MFDKLLDEMADQTPFTTALATLFEHLIALTGCPILWKEADRDLRGSFPRTLSLFLHPRCLAIKDRDNDSLRRCVRQCGHDCYDPHRETHAIHRITCHAGCSVWRVPIFHRGELQGVAMIGPLRQGTHPAELIPAPATIDHLCGLIADLIALMAPLRDQQRQAEDLTRLHPGLRQILHLLRTDARHDLDAKTLARYSGLSVSRLRHLCRDQAEATLAQLRDRAVLERAQQNLVETVTPIGRIAEELGFNNQRYFASWFRRLTGSSPSAWRRQQPGAEEV